jgi:hypothetical protein
MTELPGLVLALSERFGRVRQVMLHGGTWENQFRRLAIGPQVVRAGWFASISPALLVATTDRGDQIDLLVVPPSTEDSAAKQAMATAAGPANTKRAPEILAN